MLHPLNEIRKFCFNRKPPLGREPHIENYRQTPTICYPILNICWACTLITLTNSHGTVKAFSLCECSKKRDKQSENIVELIRQLKLILDNIMGKYCMPVDKTNKVKFSYSVFRFFNPMAWYLEGPFFSDNTWFETWVIASKLRREEVFEETVWGRVVGNHSGRELWK